MRVPRYYTYRLYRGVVYNTMTTGRPFCSTIIIEGASSGYNMCNRSASLSAQEFGSFGSFNLKKKNATKAKCETNDALTIFVFEKMFP